MVDVAWGVVVIVAYVLSIAAALSLGSGYVIQQRVAAQRPDDVLSWHMIVRLFHTRLWWWGLAATIVGQILGGAALAFSGVAVVEPLLSLSLLVAFGVAAAQKRHAPRWQEIVGALLLTGSLAVFLATSAPHGDDAARTDTLSLAIGIASCVAIAAALVAVARRKSPAVEAMLLATGAGVLYGLQDVATRGVLVIADHHGIGAVIISVWPYVVIGTGALGIFLAQSAFGAARLDYSLPPATATEPVVAIGIGAGVLGEHLPTGAGTLAIDAIAFVALVCSVVLIGRSPALRHTHPVRQPVGAGIESRQT